MTRPQDIYFRVPTQSTTLNSHSSFSSYPKNIATSQSSNSREGIIDCPGSLPPEIWILIIQYANPIDLFSLYNTSVKLRKLVVPSLVQLLGSKTIRLYFYQEYVCRTGITFVFDHFDMTHDKVVFKPQYSHHTITFKNGITIQRPQLEEISVKSRGSRFQGGKVIQSEKGVYYITEKQGPSSLPPASAPRRSTPSASFPQTNDANYINSSSSTNKSDHNSLFQYSENDFAMLNYLDRVCALNIKRTGSRYLSGAKHSFGHNYPWVLRYVIDDKPNGDKGNFGSRINDDGMMGNNNNNDSPTNQRSSNVRSRYLQASGFECSINFLDPRRASRSLFRRWIEGKMGQLLHIVRTRQRTQVPYKRKQYPCRVHMREEVSSINNVVGC